MVLITIMQFGLSSLFHPSSILLSYLPSALSVVEDDLP